MSQGEKDCEECLTSTISAKLHEGAQKAESLFSSACIYRVPEELRKLNASAYTPRLIAIGPLHRNDNHLQTPMQQVKMSYANHLLCRLTEGLEGLEDREQKRLSLLQECVAEMKLSIDDAKKCYAEEVTLDVEMMLVDGCFILELLYRNRLILESNSSIGNIDSSHPIVGSDNGDPKETMTASTEPQLQTMAASTSTEPQLQTITASTEGILVR
ncbi:hypothetical protein RHGRI_015415 [Rhododendron griersonianum]|uniref:Uncharacterized protein n=1 Tax=Rhododendron griersonianum TaxID=479676 RepID=A0AAV6KDT1_9ERIC|nr:hypothetical protein RHGRI_015415 [Rhododendron griersonianum]